MGFFIKQNLTKPNTVIVASKPIARMYRIEIGTITHMLAEESLIFVERADDLYDVFSDNGELELTVLFRDLCAANASKIRKEQLKRLAI